MIYIKKKDIYWSYLSQIFVVLSGLLTLPLILRLLSTDEIGMNYLMLTLGSLVSLFDFGFTPQFSRNLTYIFSGAQELKKKGIKVCESSEINYRLLATMISTSKFLYKRLALFTLIILITFGTLYIYIVTGEFNNIDNALLIWLLFSSGIFFNIYYSYYNSLLIGKGLIMESQKAIVYTKLLNIILMSILLYLNIGLLSVVISNLISPFLGRYLSYKYFFTEDLKNKINSYNISKEEIFHLFKIVWYNAKKIGLVFVGSYSINKLSIFMAGIYFSLEDIASYGLMIQLFGLVSVFSMMFFKVFEPKFSALRLKGNKTSLIKLLASVMNIYYITFIIFSLLVIYNIPLLLSIFGSSVVLPSKTVLITFAIILFLEGNHSCFSTFIVTNNNVPFVTSSLVAGFFIAIGNYISLSYTHYGILGLISVRGIVQLSYANWKWPKLVLVEFNKNIFSFLTLGIRENMNYVTTKIFPLKK